MYLPPSSGQSRVYQRSRAVIAYRWRSLPRVRPYRAASINSPLDQDSSSNECCCCLFRYRHGPINFCLSFPHPNYTIYWYMVYFLVKWSGHICMYVWWSSHIILLNKCYYHRRTRLNAMKLYLQPMILPKSFDIFSPWLGDAQKV